MVVRGDSPEGIEVIAGGSPGGGTPGPEIAKIFNPGGVGRKVQFMNLMS